MLMSMFNYFFHFSCLHGIVVVVVVAIFINALIYFVGGNI